MNPTIANKCGYKEQMKRAENGQCPACGNTIISDHFKDELSRNEFYVSGMCQKCQDEF